MLSSFKSSEPNLNSSNNASNIGIYDLEVSGDNIYMINTTNGVAYRLKRESDRVRYSWQWQQLSDVKFLERR